MGKAFIKKFLTKEKQNEKVMFLYYPEESETLWSISKKYNVSPKEIEKANSQTEAKTKKEKIGSK